LASFLNTIKSTIVAESARFSYFLTKPFFKKNIWIIGETEYQAQENGYELFCWLEKNISNIDLFYVIDKASPAIYKFNERTNWLVLGSFKQVFYLYHANRIISTHGLWMIPNEFGILKKLTRKTLKAKRVMLNHGVGFLKNGKKYYHKSIFPLNDLIISLSPKHKKIFTNEYGYIDGEVSITGYPRFDSMTDMSDQSKWNNMILLMPTFRDNEQGLGDQFKDTELYQRIRDLVNDVQLQGSLKNIDGHLVIYLHQNIQGYTHYLDKFSSKRVHIVRQGDFSVTELLRMSKLLITDYSSVFFDFVYMNKPFISYQFDYNNFIASRIDRAFIDIRTELPGYVVTNHDALIDKIQFIVNDKFVLSHEHKLRASTYFSYQDKNNCKRVYHAIKSLS